MNDDVRSVFATRSSEIAALGERLCALILEMYPDAVVTVDGGDIGFGSTAGYKGLVFTVAPQARHVTLGIAGGASMPDPAGLMEGVGKVHRHVKVRQAADVDRPELRELMLAALARRH
jgi:hypothetical protein